MTAEKFLIHVVRSPAYCGLGIAVLAFAAFSGLAVIVALIGVFFMRLAGLGVDDRR